MMSSSVMTVFGKRRKSSLESFFSLDYCGLLLTGFVRWQAEFLNPGGSVKDRAALYIVKVKFILHVAVSRFISAS